MLMMSRKKNLNPQGELCNEAKQRVTKAKFLGIVAQSKFSIRMIIDIYQFSYFFCIYSQCSFSCVDLLVNNGNAVLIISLNCV